MPNRQQWYHRWAPSLGELEDTPENIWGTLPYDPEKHINEPTVFCGLYGLPDFYALWRHKGQRAIWWTGSDICHFRLGYWLNEKGSIRLDNQAMAKWINKNCENWVENEIEMFTLLDINIKSKICPSFLGDINQYKIEFKPNNQPKVYVSVSHDDFELYGWPRIERLADQIPEVTFYLYGSDKWKSQHKNVIVRGRVIKEMMNQEIKQMQAGLRLIKMEGFSEIVAKSILWGQWPISRIKYKYIDSFYHDRELLQILSNLKQRHQPNIQGRIYYLTQLNRYPWNNKI